MLYEVITSPASLAKSYLRSQGKVILTLLLLVMAINFLFGIDHLAKFAAVDEPLWTFERVPQFFRNILDGDWDKTNISDKPGITVALISGWGIFWENPRVYKKYYKDGEVDSNPYDIADLNLAMRLPIFLFAIFSLPIFYFFLERLLGKTAAIYSTILIGLVITSYSIHYTKLYDLFRRTWNWPPSRGTKRQSCRQKRTFWKNGKKPSQTFQC